MEETVMAFCTKCGAFVDDTAAFCTSCGAQTGSGAASGGGAEQQSTFDRVTNTEDVTSAFTPEDIEKNKAMAIFSYIGILVIVPILAAKDSPYAKFHSNQGLVLLIAWVIYSIITGVINNILNLLALRMIFSLASLLFIALAVLGIVNAAGGKAKKLPLIGELTIIK
jgi:uncharacterized membrane protein